VCILVGAGSKPALVSKFPECCIVPHLLNAFKAHSIHVTTEKLYYPLSHALRWNAYEASTITVASTGPKQTFRSCAVVTGIAETWLRLTKGMGTRKKCKSTAFALLHQITLKAITIRSSYIVLTLQKFFTYGIS